MTDNDPYAQYLRSSSGGTPSAAASPDADPYAQYLKPSRGATPAAASAPTAPPTGIGDSLINAWEQATRTGNQTGLAGMGAAVKDYGKSISDQLTFGLADKAQSMLTGEDVNAIRARTQQAQSEIGTPMNAITGVAAYGLGPGKFATGSKIAELMGGNLAARMAGSAAEGAGSAALGTAGHGDTDTGDLLKSAAIGGGTGLVTGALPGATSTPVSKTTAELEKDATNAWKTGPEVTPVNPTDVARALAGVNKTLSIGDRNLLRDSTLSKKIGNVQQDLYGATTADDVAKFQRSIRGAADDETGYLANRYNEALENSLGAAKPTVDAARLATTRAKAVDELNGLIADPKSAPAAIPGLLAKKGSFYDTLHPELRPMLEDISQMGGPSIKSDIANRAIKTGVGMATGALSHAVGLGPVGGIIGGPLASAIMPSVSGVINTAPIKASLAAVRHLAATGQKLPPSAFAPPAGPLAQGIGDLARQSGYAYGASGGF